MRAVSTEGFGRIHRYTELRRRLETDEAVLAFFGQSTSVPPGFYAEQVKRDLGPLWRWLPEDALTQDHHAYLNAHEPAASRESQSAAHPVPARPPSPVPLVSLDAQPACQHPFPGRAGTRRDRSWEETA